MMPNKRKARRRPIVYPSHVFVGDGIPVGRCKILDISEFGARLKFEESLPSAQEFTLLLSTNGRARRRCHVVWQSESEIGVQFLASKKT